jgi:hypothetical protein
VFPACKRSLYEAARRLDSANQLHDQIATVVDDFFRIVGQKFALNSGALSLRITHQYLRNAQVHASTLANQRAVPANEFHQATANCAATQ